MKNLTEYDGRKRVIIEGVYPAIDGGRFPAKRTLGDQVRVEADIFTDGHDSISASLLAHREGSDDWTEIPMRPLVNDRWTAAFRVGELGRYGFKVKGWVDHFETWRRDLLKRIKAESDAPVDYLIGADLIDQAASRAVGPDSDWLRHRATVLRSDKEPKDLRTHATDPTLHELVLRYPDKHFATESDRELVIVVDPVRARFSAWYEFFPRSTSPEPGRHGTFADCEKRLTYISEMGFDVVYLPPIHPIGVNFRKGRNNSPQSQPGDYGSPWAIGSADGGHKSIHPELGTLDDFHRFVAKVKDLDMSLALDIAFQAAPDHPYVQRPRETGSVSARTEPFNTPKTRRRSIRTSIRSTLRARTGRHVGGAKERLRLLDRPGRHHLPRRQPAYQSFSLLGMGHHRNQAGHPEVLFLAEAFTRPKIMYRLAKLGFSQSYTYFPWRNAKAEITAYLTELTQPPVRDFFRPNQWPNTPDILTEFLQIGGRAVFTIRLLLAATLGSNYGIYGPAFELMEHRAVRHGSEEYLDSEKYEIYNWDLDRPDSLRPAIARVNAIRNENEALQSDWSLKFHPVDNDQLICYSKESDDRSNLILVVVNLDPRHTQSGYVTLPLDELQIPFDRAFEAEDLLTGERYLWHGPRNYVELSQNPFPGHVLKIHRKLKVETDFEYFL